MNDWMPWYAALAKPAWTPAPATIGLIWNVLYPIIGLTFGFVFWRTLRGRLPGKVAVPFAINLAANLAFTPILFGLKNLTWASADILLVLSTIVWGMFAVGRHHPWIAAAQVPYLAWVATATVLQLSITAMNR